MQYPRALFQTFTGIYLANYGVWDLRGGERPRRHPLIGLFSTIFVITHMKEALTIYEGDPCVDTMRKH